VVTYGGTESYADRLDALFAVRSEHDRTGLVTAVVLRPVSQAITGSAGSDGRFGATSGWDDLKTVAVARLVCDRVPHVRVAGHDPELAGVALRFGADQIERPGRPLGATDPGLERVVTGAGRTLLVLGTLA